MNTVIAIVSAVVVAAAILAVTKLINLKPRRWFSNLVLAMLTATCLLEIYRAWFRLPDDRVVLGALAASALGIAISVLSWNNRVPDKLLYVTLSAYGFASVMLSLAAGH